MEIREVDPTVKPEKPADPKPTKAPAATSAPAKGAAVKAVNTGDESPIGYHLMMMLAALAGIAGVLLEQKKRKERM